VNDGQGSNEADKRGLMDPKQIEENVGRFWRDKVKEAIMEKKTLPQKCRRDLRA
jgi:hypothetical protein